MNESRVNYMMIRDHAERVASVVQEVTILFLRGRVCYPGRGWSIGHWGLQATIPTREIISASLRQAGRSRITWQDKRWAWHRDLVAHAQPTKTGICVVSLIRTSSLLLNEVSFVTRSSLSRGFTA